MGGPGSGPRHAKYASTAQAWAFDIRPPASCARRRELEYGEGMAWTWVHARRPGHADVRVWLGFDVKSDEVTISYDRPDRPARPRRPWQMEEEQASETLGIVRQACTYDRGDRARWLASCPGCEHPTATFYLVAGKPWQCRTCAGLAYESTRLRTPQRLLAGAAKLRRKFGCAPAGLFDFAMPERPARRWRRRFAHEQVRILGMEARALQMLCAQLDGIDRKLAARAKRRAAA